MNNNPTFAPSSEVRPIGLPKGEAGYLGANKGPQGNNREGFNQ